MTHKLFGMKIYKINGKTNPVNILNEIKFFKFKGLRALRSTVLWKNFANLRNGFGVLISMTEHQEQHLMIWSVTEFYLSRKWL